MAHPFVSTVIRVAANHLAVALLLAVAVWGLIRVGFRQVVIGDRRRLHPVVGAMIVLCCQTITTTVGLLQGALLAMCRWRSDPFRRARKLDHSFRWSSRERVLLSCCLCVRHSWCWIARETHAMSMRTAWRGLVVQFVWRTAGMACAIGTLEGAGIRICRIGDSARRGTTMERVSRRVSAEGQETINSCIRGYLDATGGRTCVSW